MNIVYVLLIVLGAGNATEAKVPDFQTYSACAEKSVALEKEIKKLNLKRLEVSFRCEKRG